MNKKNYEVYTAACNYIAAGFEVIPDHPEKKFPAGIDGWQTKVFTPDDLEDKMLNQGWHVGIRNIEGLDIDNNGSPDAKALLNDWSDLVKQVAPNLIEKLLIEQTRSGGYHVVWKCKTIEGNQKLAERPPLPEELEKDSHTRSVVLIETRGSGGQFVVAPSTGYTIQQGDWCKLPTITPSERQTLLHCARVLDRMPQQNVEETKHTDGKPSEDDRPGDVYNKMAEAYSESLELLKKHGWDIVFQRGDTIFLKRPGKKRGVSATFNHVAPGIFYNFSGNASPFDPSRAYPPFSVLTLLEYDGDFRESAKELVKKYDIKEESVKVNVDRLRDKGEQAEPSTEEKDMKVLHPIINNEEFLSRKYPSKKWLVDGLIRASGLILFQGDGGTGKTTISYSLAKAVTTGTDWLDTFETTESKVLILDKENEAIDIQTNLYSMQATDPNIYHYTASREFSFFNQQGELSEQAEYVRDWIKENDVTVIIMDSLVDFYVGSENDSIDSARNINAWKSTFPNCSIVVIHHESKPSEKFKKKAKHRVRGSGNFFNTAQSVLSFSVADEEDHPEKILVEHAKVRGAKKHKIFEIEMLIEDDPNDPRETVITGFKYLGEIDTAKQKREEAFDAILDLLEREPERKFTAKDLENELGDLIESPRNIQIALPKLRDSNLVAFDMVKMPYKYWHLKDGETPKSSENIDDFIENI